MRIVQQGIIFQHACFDIGLFPAKRPPRSKMCDQKTLLPRELMRILRSEVRIPIAETKLFLGV